jgi:hypothetical protein
VEIKAKIFTRSKLPPPEIDLNVSDIQKLGINGNDVAPIDPRYLFRTLQSDITLNANDDGCPNLKYKTTVRTTIELSNKNIAFGFMYFVIKNIKIENATPIQAGINTNGKSAQQTI